MLIPFGPRLAAGIAAAILAAGSGPQSAWREIGGPPPPTAVSGPEVRDPFFELLLELGDRDSLVAWSGAEVVSALAPRGRRSLLPLADVDSLVRRRPAPGEIPPWPGGAPVAVWELVLPGEVSRPLPYAVLGYHPGSVRCSRRLVLLELRLPAVDLPLRGADDAVAMASEVRIHPLLRGHVVLDVDGIVDAILGSMLDDAWTLAFVSARLDDERVGVATAVGREGQPVFGEFDFREDQVVLDGRLETAALSRLARSLVRAHRGFLPPPWSWPAR